MRSDEVIIKGAPRIEGLSFRRIKGDPDFKVLAEVIQKSRDADKFEFVETARDIADDFRHLQNCNPAKDLLYVDVEGRLIGFSQCEWHSRESGVRTYEQWAYLLPEWRVKNLRRIMVRENERRLREIAADHPSTWKKFFETISNYMNNPWKSLMLAEGYKPYRHNLQMKRSTSGRDLKIPMPEGLETRPYRSEDLRQIFNAAEEAFKEEPNYSEEMWTEEAFALMTGSRLFRPDLWIVAWDGDDVAGGVMNIIDDEENRKFGRSWGYIAAVFVTRPYRHKGLASALIIQSIHMLRKAGLKEAALGVDSENPTGARRVYERLGFKEWDHYVHLRKPLI